jgi:hypothetical protein
MPVSYVANGDIYPARFVKLDPADGKVVQCLAGDLPIGISQEGTRRSPYTDTPPLGRAAAAGEQLAVYTLGERAVLQVNATVTPGTRLKADANGMGIPVVAASVDAFGGYALFNGIAGKLIEVVVDPGNMPGV